MKRRQHEHCVTQCRHQIIQLNKGVPQNTEQKQNSQIPGAVMNNMKQQQRNAATNQRSTQSPAISLLCQCKTGLHDHNNCQYNPVAMRAYCLKRLSLKHLRHGVRQNHGQEHRNGHAQGMATIDPV